MMNSVNLIGRLTRDPEVRKTQTDKSVANFTIACERGFGKNKRVDYVNLQAWGFQADFIGDYIKKGFLVSIEGHVQSRSYEGRDGRKIYVQEVLVAAIKSLETRESVNAISDDYQEQVKDQSNEFDASDSDPVLDITSDDLPF